MPPLRPDLDLSIGAIEIALNISAFLAGCATIQTYTYYRNFPSDRLFMKVLVWPNTF
ncbi:hypothetical protein E1B28_001710 [Marasmius oreades]|uniref:Uncharacterized protein n=1 Tax=Marasmius oreades TaxID=181124 RepID=A0A9P8AFP4_9AGAR|nr:uncharacterized protein E1B28_001710 [Marasmius oreades]KAG7099912.1 hypothetical protein E1B28_001710 [Marasmius oreades]